MKDNGINEIVQKVANGEGLTNEEASKLIEFTAAVDQRGVLAEDVLQFVISSAGHIYNEIAERVVKECNFRDISKAKAVLSIGTKAADRLTSVTQIYIAHIFNQLQQPQEEEVVNESAVADTQPDILGNEDPA